MIRIAALFIITFLQVTSSVAENDQSLIRIPGGTFIMGNDHGLADEQPAHKVTVKTFYLGRTVVSNKQFAKFLNKHSRKAPTGELIFDWDDSDARIKRLGSGEYVPFEGHENMPVIEASWLGARNYCASIGKRLPTEAEWEFAARGPEGRLYPWGNSLPNKTRAHYNQSWGDMAPVDAHPDGATPEGILGMAGNVHEWTSSKSEPYPYRADDGREGVDYYSDRVTRGGSHDGPANELIATWRGETVSRNPMAGHHNIGFRCAKSIERLARH